MKTSSFLIAALFAALTCRAQLLPCSTFENPNPLGNWTTSLSTVTFNSPNSLDNSQFAEVGDLGGPSSFGNSVDFRNLGQNHLHRCLCFDIKLISDGMPTSHSYNPRIFIEDVVGGIGLGRAIVFTSSVTLIEGLNWRRVCIPIEHCSASTYPSNASGSWAPFSGLTCNDFNTILDNSFRISFDIDINTYQGEIWGFDNVCIVNCRTCEIDFNLQNVINSNGTASSEINILPIESAYNMLEVSWGDGSPTVWLANGTLNASHSYLASGTYNVCVTLYDLQGNVVCKKCITFCYSEPSTDFGPLVAPIEGKAATSQLFNNKHTELKRAYLSDNSTEMEKRFMVYPNPAKDYIELILPEVMEAYPLVVRLNTSMGDVVFETEIDSNKTRLLKINTAAYEEGIYFIELVSNGKVDTQKVLLVK